MNTKDKLKLIRPSIELKKQALDFKQEIFTNGESIINGSGLLDRTDSFEDWLESVSKNTNEETVDKNWVVTDTFFAVRESDDKIVGIIDLRHSLNDFLKDLGNCGYTVRPTERNKGYATEMLKMILITAKKIGLDKIHLSVDKNNIPSVKTIVRNGGIYERSFQYEECLADIYIIDL